MTGDWYRKHRRQFFPLPNQAYYSGTGIAEDAGYGLFRLEARKSIGIGECTFSHSRFISYFSKNKQQKNRLPKRVVLTGNLVFHPLAKEMTHFI